MASSKIISLDQAWYCESCRAISNDATCLNCASAEHSFWLAKWLDREPPITIRQPGVVVFIYPEPRCALTGSLRAGNGFVHLCRLAPKQEESL